MPSPIGHALGSLIVGSAQKRGWLWLAMLGVAPDLDLLWGRHSMETHSVGAAVIAGFVLASAQGVRTGLSVRTWSRTFVLIAAVWFAHPLMDALGADSSPPRGVMLWWPFSSEFVIAPVSIFDAVSRMYWRDDFVSHNLAAILKEILILAPILVGVWIWRRRASIS